MTPHENDAVSIEESGRAGHLRSGIRFLLGFFLLAGGANTAATGNLAFGLPVIGLNALLVLALVLVRRGKYVAAGTLTVFDVYINVNLVIYFIPFSHYLEMYRYLTFMIALLLVALLISFERRQVNAVGLLNLITFNLAFWLRVRPRIGAVTGEPLSVYIAGNLTLAVSAALASAAFLFSKEMVRAAGERAEESARRLRTISAAVDSAANGLRIGEELEQETGKALEAIDRLCGESTNVLSEAGKLHEAVRDSDESGRELKSGADLLKAAMERQEEIIRGTGKSIERIRKELSLVRGLSTEKKEHLARLAADAGKRSGEVAESLKILDRVIESSKQMGAQVSLIEDIAARTNLLAMNAAIVAARAGEAGKGFAVVTGEIKRLSDETNENTDRILRNLEENDRLVAGAREASSLIFSLFEEVKAELEEVSGTLDEMNGAVEKAAGVVTDIDEGTDLLLDSSRSTGEGAAALETAIRRETGTAERVSAAAAGVEEGMHRLRDAITLISESNKRIEATGRRNKTALDVLFRTIHHGEGRTDV